MDGGTQVTVLHSGWRAIRPDHPARHRLPVDDFLREIGLWWGGLLSALRVQAQTPLNPPAAPR